MIIRQITQADIPTLIEMGGDMHRESQFRELEYEPAKCYEIAYASIIGPHSVLVIVAEDKGAIIGMLAAHCSPHFFSNDRAAQDFIVYVKPEHRGSTAFVRLVKEYVSWAKEQGAKQIYLGTSTEINTERTADLYEKIGFKKVGYVFKHNGGLK